MIYRTDDPLADFHRWDSEQERLRNRLPKCFVCGKRITDEKAYCIDGIYICDDCAGDDYTEDDRRDVEV